MTVEEDAKRERATHEGEGAAPEGAAEENTSADGTRASQEPPADALANAGPNASGVEPAEADEDHDVSPVAPTQMGARRWVYAAYFAAAIGIAFISSKVLDFAWTKAQNYKPAIGDPRDEIVMPISAIVGGGIAFYCWFRTKLRQLAEEVAAEMSKVTWPDRTEVTNGTVVVIVTTVVSTVFFALMDRFWSFITNLVYGGT